MALQSFILGNGNARLEQAAAGPPSIKRLPPADDMEAVRSIQLALVELGYPLPQSFADGPPDGLFGTETYNAVVAYQKKAFPGQPSEWDGRVGQKTLAKMDEQLPRREPSGRIPATYVRLVSLCEDPDPYSDAATAEPAPELATRRIDGSIGLPGRTA